MAVNDDLLNTFGEGMSTVKKGVQFKDLSLVDLEKELKNWQKLINDYDKKVNSFPAFSSQQNAAIQQRDQAIEGLLNTTAFLTNKSQTYTPLPGPELKGSLYEKEQKVADRYKGFDLTGSIEMAKTFKAGQTGRGGGMNPVAAQLLPLVKKGSSFIPKTTTTATTTAVPVASRTDAQGRTGMGATAVNPPVVPPVVPKLVGGDKPGTGLKKGEVLFDGKKVKVGGSKWQQIIQDEFGSLWDVYNDNPDVHKVIDQAVKEGWYNDETKLTSRLQNTNWFRTTESATRQYNIKKSTDPATLASDIEVEKENLRGLSLKSGSGVVLSDTTLNDLAEKRIKFGWSDQQAMNAIGSESVATATSGGPQGTAALRQGSTASKLRGLADDYAQKVDPAMLDTWTAEILSGTKTEDQFIEQMKMRATQQYRSLAPQIEKNQTVKDAVSMYGSQAQNVLGIDPSTIDWTQDKWNKALNYKDPKTNEYRTMDASEWNRHLRAQPEWKKTDDAKTIYRNLAFTLASGFGKTL